MKSRFRCVCPADLVEDLWVEILKRLPLITLCRLRCVCKSLNSLISSSSFINNINSSINKSYIIFSCYWRVRSYAFLQSPDEQHPTFSGLPFRPTPTLAHVAEYQVIDVAGGVVCLSPAWNHAHPNTASAVLWNPTTRRYVEIPTQPEQQNPPLWRRVIGFGFNARNNEFKVVRCTHSRFSFPTPPPTFEAFSTRERRWRSVAVDHLPPFSLDPDHEPYNNTCSKDGNPHWIIKRYVEAAEVDSRRGRFYYEKAVLVFSCERDEFETMELPREMNEKTSSFMSPWVSVSRGMLSLLAVAGPTQEGRELEEWVMEEYGNSSSWKKVGARDQRDFVNIMDSGRVRQLKVDEQRRKLVWKQINGVLHRSHQPINGAYVFQPSLLLMDAQSQALSYTIVKNHQDGEVYYVKDGTPYRRLHIS